MANARLCSARPHRITQWRICAKLIQFDGRARGDDVMGNLISQNYALVKLQSVCQLTAAAPIHKTGF